MVHEEVRKEGKGIIKSDCQLLCCKLFVQMLLSLEHCTRVVKEEKQTAE